jgi:hypothetical protein
MTPAHLAEEDLVLLYYNDPALDPALRAHGTACAECRRALESLARVLDACDEYREPELPGNYEMRVWSRLRPRLIPAGSHRRWWMWSPALAAVVIIAFLGGMFLEKIRHAKTSGSSNAISTAAITPQGRERVLLVAIGDHLDRSQIVLAELVNASGAADISRQQQSAGDLVQESRLLRQTAAHSGDTADARLLEDLERVLLEIAHSPAQLSSPELARIKERIEDQGLLFKVRIIRTNLRQKEQTL